MAGDLDCSDLAEVRHRVVDPVLAAVIARGELTVVSLGFELPPGWEGSWADTDYRQAWVVLAADGGESQFEYPVGKAIFWRSDAEHAAERLASELDEWICLSTRFGWGGGHGLGEYVVPEPEWPSSGRVLEVYPAEEVSLPVWERGVQVTGELPGLSSELRADLITWHRDLDDAVEAMNPEPVQFETPSRPGVWVEVIEDHVYAERKRRDAARREAGYASWREFAEEFEGRRDDLIGRLRAELGPECQVLTPPRIP